MSSDQRIYSLDVFRGIAAVAVVLYHYTTRYTQRFDSLYLFSIYWGWLGVPVFLS